MDLLTILMSKAKYSGLSFGSPAVFESASTRNSSICYDSTNNKIVIAYTDVANSNYGTAVVGTVNGTSITFGTPVVFESASTSSSTSHNIVFDSANGKVVITYEDVGNLNYGTAVVGTVSGTSISFGTPVVFHSDVTVRIDSVYDVDSGKVIIAFQDNNAAGAGNAIVGTVSGTSISFGTKVTFNTVLTSPMRITYDTVNSKVVIVYSKNSISTESVVGTVSGTSISFGTEVQISSSACQDMGAAFDSSSGKVVVLSNRSGATLNGTAIVGTVSGTSISYGTPVVFLASQVSYLDISENSSRGKMLVSCQDTVTSKQGIAIEGAVSGTSISFDDALVFETGEAKWIRSAITTDGETVVAYTDINNSSYGTSIVG